MKLIMLVGLPGSGKSTKAEELRKQGFIVHSSDAIRNELNLHSLDDTQKVFDILHERILEDMKDNKDIVYDSTNLTIRRRRKFLKLIRDFDYEKICYVIDTPIKVCKIRNSKRTGYDKGTDKEINNIELVFNKPTYAEGWDSIIKYKEELNI